MMTDTLIKAVSPDT